MTATGVLPGDVLIALAFAEAAAAAAAALTFVGVGVGILKDEGERKSECLAFNLQLETSQARRNQIFWRIRESMTRHLANRESRLP
jgi:hypothetical protein